MNKPTRESRIKGAILGAFIGDALALGPHWYYDLDELQRSFGTWIDNYTTPKPDRYHAGLSAGDSSQSGLILALTLRSLIAQQGYDETDFCQRLEQTLFTQLDGSPMAGPGGYTSQSIRWVWQKRQEGKPWGSIAGPADTTEAAERCLALAIYYAFNEAELAKHVSQNIALTQYDSTVAAMSLAYCLVLGQLINGQPLDAQLSQTLMAKVQRGELPFHCVTTGSGTVPQGAATPVLAGQFASPDALLTVSSIAKAAQDPNIRIEPAWKASLVYGLPCAVYHQLPAVYYLAARFQGDFENAVLSAVNGGGQNMSRAMLTGALCGAIGGLEAIPTRFLSGLKNGSDYLALADTLARLAPQN